MRKAISGEQQRRRRTGEQFIASGGHIHDVFDRILIKTKTPMNLLMRFYDGAVHWTEWKLSVTELLFNYWKIMITASEN